MKIKGLLPLAVICTAPAIASVADQPGMSRYSVASNNAHAVHGINVAVANAYLKPGLSIAPLTSLAFQAEIGDIDFADDMEDLIDELDRDDLSLDEANALLERFNTLLPVAGEKGYFSLQLAAELPLSLVWKRENDTLSISTRVNGNALIKILDDALEYNPLQASIGTSTSGYVKVADLQELSLGYSRLVLNSDHGSLHAGARVNIQKLGLSKQVIAFESADGDDDFQDVFLDDYEENEQQTTEVAIDLSAFWAASSYSVGLTLSNVNEPEFDYGQLGENCQQKDNETSKNNCFTALHFADRISLNETYIADSYATVQGSYLNPNYGLSLDVSLESEHNTPVGVLEQWATASISGSPDSIFIPNARLTYAKNLTGSELSYLSGELSWGWLGLSGGYSLESTSVDDESTTRGAFLNLSVSYNF